MKTNQFRWLAETIFAMLIMVSALPASAQEEIDFFNWQFKSTEADDGSGWIISPNKNDGFNWNELNLWFYVPAMHPGDGRPIVGLDGFSYLDRMDNIVFEEGSQLKFIGDGCFEGCTSLMEINFPETVETIGNYAFYGCTMLYDLTLPSNLKNIGVSAFEKCTSLQSITLPKSLKLLREWAFRYCTSLKTVVFEDEVDFYTNNVFCFYNGVFHGCESLSSVTLPKKTPGYFYIPMGTFRWCGNLKSIEFPANTRTIEAYAFDHSGLESLDLTTIELDEYFLTGYYTFAECRDLKTVKAKGKLRIDGLYTFQRCAALETVTVTGEGDDYMEICPDVFRYCDNLKSVDVYRLKGKVGYWAVGHSNEMDSVFVDCKSLERVTSVCTPEISQIGVSCFDGCTSLTRVDLPEQEFVINETAFRNCAALQSFDMTNVTSIGTKAFTGCGALTSISIKSETNDPPAMDNADAFDEWHYDYTEVDVLEKRYLDFAADEYWNKFKGLKHPSMFAYDVVEGGYSIRKGQYALDADLSGMLIIPEQYQSGDVVAIAKDAFKGLTVITGVTLPARIASIGTNAFMGCTNIEKVINHATLPLCSDICPEDAFDPETYSKGNLYVPFGSLDAYKALAPWSSFNDRIYQGLGERVLNSPQPSHDSGVFKDAFDLTLTNPNETGSIYYYIVHEGDNPTEVREVHTYTVPISIPEQSCTVWAYINDGTSCCEPVFRKYSYRKVITLDETTDNTISACVADVTLKRTIVADVWNTLVLPFSLTNDEVLAAFGEGAQVASFSNTDGENVNFNITAEGITANVPVLLKAAQGTEYTFEGYTLVEGAPVAEGAMYDFVGTYAAQHNLADNEYMLYGDKFWRNEGDGYKVKGFRAYLRPKSGSAAKSLNLVIDGQTTGLKLNTLTGEVESYNLAGQRVPDSYKGLVIKKGKKVIKRQ